MQEVMRTLSQQFQTASRFPAFITCSIRHLCLSSVRRCSCWCPSSPTTGCGCCGRRSRGARDRH